MNTIKTRQNRINENREKNLFKKKGQVTGLVIAGVVASVALFGVGLKVTEAFNQEYVVQKGDTLYGLSRKFDTSVKELKAVNELSSSKIIVGEMLLIPEFDHSYTVEKGDTVFSISKKFHIDVEQLKAVNNLDSDVIFTGQTLKVPEMPVTYVVGKGDTIFSISKKLQVSVGELKKLNNLNGDHIWVGQRLKVPGAKVDQVVSGGHIGQKLKAVPVEIYTVQKGDTVFSIAQRFQMEVTDLKAANSLRGNEIKAGQQLVIPFGDGFTDYLVEKGDTVFSIARKHLLSVEELKKMNNLKSNQIYVGQALLIPGEVDAHSPEVVYTIYPGDTLFAVAKRFDVPVEDLTGINGLGASGLVSGQKLIIPGEVEFIKAEVVGVLDNSTVEFQDGAHSLALKIPHGSREKFSAIVGKTVFVAYKNGAVIEVR